MDLSFVQHDVHRELLCEVLAASVRDPEVVGVLLLGSVARRTARPGSDLDIRLLLRDGCSRPSVDETRDGVLVEVGSVDRRLAEAKLDSNPMEPYRYLDSRILHDPYGWLRELTEIARARFEGYRTPEGERRSIAHWLISARIKMAASLEQGDYLRAAYVAHTTSWQILTGLWAVNDLPMPPAGSVWDHLDDLRTVPDDLIDELHALFLGDTSRRVDTAMSLIDWLVPRLRGKPE